MSFDVFLQRFAGGESAEVDRRPVREVLRSARHRGPDTFGFYVVAFPDGVEVEFSAKGLESKESFTGCAFHFRGFGDALMTFVFEVARAGDMVIIPAMEGNPLVLLSEEQQTRCPSRPSREVSLNCRPLRFRTAVASSAEDWRAGPLIAIRFFDSPSRSEA